MSTEGKNIASAGVSRRSFLMGLGATAAVVAGSGLAGCAPQSTAAPASAESGSDAASANNTSSATGAQKPDTIQAAAETPAEKQETKDVDFVIVGSGVAGMSAAVEASRAGAKVVVLEKHNVTGGDSSICSGNFYCCGAKKQDELGYT
ncbi:FAD-dependent oxidoreductase, partial [Eggerthella sp.]